jgi:hypothetical protein
MEIFSNGIGRPGVDREGHDFSRAASFANLDPALAAEGGRVDELIPSGTKASAFLPLNGTTEEVAEKLTAGCFWEGHEFHSCR